MMDHGTSSGHAASIFGNNPNDVKFNLLCTQANSRMTQSVNVTEALNLKAERKSALPGKARPKLQKQS